jgi:hypothetical protein
MFIMFIGWTSDAFLSEKPRNKVDSSTTSHRGLGGFVPMISSQQKSSIQQHPAAAFSVREAMDTVKYINSYCPQLRTLARDVLLRWFHGDVFCMDLNIYMGPKMRIPIRLPCLFGT